MAIMNYVGAPDKSSGKYHQNIHIQYDLIEFIPLDHFDKKLVNHCKHKHIVTAALRLCSECPIRQKVFLRLSGGIIMAEENGTNVRLVKPCGRTFCLSHVVHASASKHLYICDADSVSLSAGSQPYASEKRSISFCSFSKTEALGSGEHGGRTLCAVVFCHAMRDRQSAAAEGFCHFRA